MSNWKVYLYSLFLLGAILGCAVLLPAISLTQAPFFPRNNLTSPSYASPTDSAALVTPVASASASATPVPGIGISASATITARPSPSEDIWIQPEDVNLYPVPRIYRGDWVTFQIRPHGLEAAEPKPVQVTVYRESAAGDQAIAQGTIQNGGLGVASEADLSWVWNTANLTGTQKLRVVLDPGRKLAVGDPDRSNDAAEISVDILPADQRPKDENGAHWASATIDCCVLYYVTGTAAERDLSQIESVANDSVTYIQDRMHLTFDSKLQIFLIDRVLGQGGYANDAITISYLDDDYTGGTLQQVLRHEGVHVLDHKIAKSRPTFMAEGLAVYVAGGHFKPEPIHPRAAALLALGGYIPLKQLIDDFYPTQHEVGYLEAAGFVGYLVDTYGWSHFEQFYGDFRPQNGSDSAQISAALQRHFAINLDQAEQGYRTYLQAVNPGDQMRDLQDTLHFYDTVRRYQLVLDPSAYFLNAWLPDFAVARQRGIIADAMRHPDASANAALEAVLTRADEELLDQHYSTHEELVSTVNTILDAGGLQFPAR